MVTTSKGEISEVHQGQTYGINLKLCFPIPLSCKYCRAPIRTLKNDSVQRLVHTSHQKPKQKSERLGQSAGKDKHTSKSALEFLQPRCRHELEGNSNTCH